MCLFTYQNGYKKLKGYICRRVYNDLLGYCIQIILGDLNAQIGEEMMYRPIIGNESVYDKSNETVQDQICNCKQPYSEQ